MKVLELKGKLEDLPEIAEKMLKFAGEEFKIWTFSGELGAGKTTLIKSIAGRLGVTDSVSSPTFSIINEYETKEGDVIFHFDFYRLNDLPEVYDIGTEEYFESGNYCFVEWPQIAESLLPETYLKIEIKPSGNERVFRAEKILI